MFNKSEHNLQYPKALLLSNSKRKTFEALGRDMRVSGDTVIHWIEDAPITIAQLVTIAKKLFGHRKKLYLLIDDTLILKAYSQCIEGTSDNYSSSDGTIQRSLCSVVAMLTDGKIAIPIDQAIWTSREFSSNAYMTKVQLAQQLILQVQAHITIQKVIMDGLYATTEMMQWLNERTILFDMRFHANRLIEHNGIIKPIKKHAVFALTGRQTERRITASWKEIELSFTVVKRRNRNGEDVIIYQVSNYKASAREHKKMYGYRWNIEKFFRTAKQKLGLNDCQSRKIDRQKAHILNVFLAYIIAQSERLKYKLKNVESAIKSIKTTNSNILNHPINRSREIFLCD